MDGRYSEDTEVLPRKGGIRRKPKSWPRRVRRESKSKTEGIRMKPMSWRGGIRRKPKRQIDVVTF